MRHVSFLLASLLVLTLLFGCSATVPATVPQGIQAQTGLDGISTDLTTISTASSAIVSDTAATQPSLPDIKQNAVLIQTTASHGGKLVVVTKNNVATLNNDYQVVAKKWDGIQNDYMGPKFYRLLHTFEFIGILIVIGIILLQLAPAIGIPALAGAANVVGHILTGGIVIIMTLVSKMTKWIAAKSAPVIADVGTDIGKLVSSAASKTSTALAVAAPKVAATSIPAAVQAVVK
jgi:hypothetical protein